MQYIDVVLLMIDSAGRAMAHSQLACVDPFRKPVFTSFCEVLAISAVEPCWYHRMGSTYQFAQ